MNYLNVALVAQNDQHMAARFSDPRREISNPSMNDSHDVDSSYKAYLVFPLLSTFCTAFIDVKRQFDARSQIIRRSS